MRERDWGWEISGEMINNKYFSLNLLCYQIIVSESRFGFLVF